MATKRPADATFTAAMLKVFAGTALNIFPLTAAPKLIAEGIARAVLPSSWMPQMLVFLEGVEQAISWFQDLAHGYFYVLAHGDENGPVRPPQGRERGTFVAMPLGVRELAGKIRNSRRYRKGTPIVLISCKVGAGDFPSKLADELNVKVYASPDFVNPYALTMKGRTSFPRLNWFVWHP